MARRYNCVLDMVGRVNAADVKERMAERDQRLASDTRTDLEKWFGDPAPQRSALATATHHAPTKPPPIFDAWSRSRRRISRPDAS